MHSKGGDRGKRPRNLYTDDDARFRTLKTKNTHHCWPHSCAMTPLSIRNTCTARSLIHPRICPRWLSCANAKVVHHAYGRGVMMSHIGLLSRDTRWRLVHLIPSHRHITYMYTGNISTNSRSRSLEVHRGSRLRERHIARPALHSLRMVITLARNGMARPCMRRLLIPRHDIISTEMLRDWQCLPSPRDSSLSTRNQTASRGHGQPTERP